jgi:hypothetical protein
VPNDALHRGTAWEYELEPPDGCAKTPHPHLAYDLGHNALQRHGPGALQQRGKIGGQTYDLLQFLLGRTA